MHKKYGYALQPMWLDPLKAEDLSPLRIDRGRNTLIVRFTVQCSIFEHSMTSIGRTQGLAQKYFMFQVKKGKFNSLP